MSRSAPWYRWGRWTPDETTTKLRRIEARVAGTPGASDCAVIDAIRARLVRARAGERDVATLSEIPNVLLADLFFALCDRYGIEGDFASNRT